MIGQEGLFCRCGVVLRIDKVAAQGELELLFVLPEVHSKGIGQAAWKAVEAMHPFLREPLRVPYRRILEQISPRSGRPGSRGRQLERRRRDVRVSERNQLTREALRGRTFDATGFREAVTVLSRRRFGRFRPKSCHHRTKYRLSDPVASKDDEAGISRQAPWRLILLFLFPSNLQKHGHSQQKL